MSQQEIVHQWLDDMTQSVATQDLETHMALVSRHVRVYSIPDQEEIDYAGWRQRRQNEFANNLLVNLNYKVVRIKTQALRRVAFQVEETMVARNGKTVVLDKDIMLELEPDEQWRVVEEKIHDWHVCESA